MRDSYAAYTGVRGTDLWLMLGDNAYVAGTDAEYQAAVFGTFAGLLASAPLWPAFGNHDGGSANGNTGTGVYFDIFRLPKAAEAGGVASNSEAYYSFDAGNVHFVCLDAYDVSRQPGSAMLTWLAADLAATAQTWIVAYWHHPPYTKGTHDSDTEVELVEMRQYVNPILEAGGVDLVLCGPLARLRALVSPRRALRGLDHVRGEHEEGRRFGRSGGTGPYRKPAARTPHAGTVYVVAGPAASSATGTLDHPAMLRGFAERGSVVIDVKGSRLDARFLRVDGVMRDSFAIVKSGSRSTRSRRAARSTRATRRRSPRGRDAARRRAGVCGIPGGPGSVSANVTVTGNAGAGADPVLYPGDLPLGPARRPSPSAPARRARATRSSASRGRIGRVQCRERRDRIARLHSST